MLRDYSTDHMNRIDDEENRIFKKVSPEFRKDYGRIVWVQTSNMHPWWPCYVFNPTKISTDLKLRAARLINKNHVVYYYAEIDKFDFITPDQMQDYVEKREEYGNTQKMSSRIASKFERALELADADLSLPPRERVKWKRIKKTKPKKTVPRRSSNTTFKQVKEVLKKRKKVQSKDSKSKAEDKEESEPMTKKKKSKSQEPEVVQEEEEVEEILPSDDENDEDFSEEKEDVGNNSMLGEYE